MPKKTGPPGEELLKGFWRDNPVFVQVLGMCPMLAGTNTAPNALRSTPSSNVTGTKAGQLKNGLALMTCGYAMAATHHWRNSAPATPVSPPPGTIHGRMEGLSPIAFSSPWTAKGVWASHLV